MKSMTVVARCCLPLIRSGDFTVSFNVVDKNAQAHMDMFLQALKDRGLNVEVVITDGSPLYKDSLQSYWADVEHQLCIFHVIKEVNKLILDGVRAIKNRLKRQGNKGRKKRRGRPSKKAQQQKQHSKGMSKKEQAAFIWDHQYLIVRKPEDLSEQDKQDLALMLTIAPDLKLFRQCNQQFYRLFERDISKACACSRRARLVNHAPYQANAFLAKALKKLSKDKFNHMIVFLGWEDSERTNNHVERNNRSFRMMQKTRYKRRKTHTIEKALELELYARMLAHPLYAHNVRQLLTVSQKTDPANGCITSMENEKCHYILYVDYYSSYYVGRYLPHPSWWPNVYAACGASRIAPMGRSPPHACQSPSVFRR